MSAPIPYQEHIVLVAALTAQFDRQYDVELAKEIIWRNNYLWLESNVKAACEKRHLHGLKARYARQALAQVAA